MIETTDVKQLHWSQRVKEAEKEMDKFFAELNSTFPPTGEFETNKGVENAEEKEKAGVLFGKGVALNQRIYDDAERASSDGYAVYALTFRAMLGCLTAPIKILKMMSEC